jgi:TPR repeat protein
VWTREEEATTGNPGALYKLGAYWLGVGQYNKGVKCFQDAAKQKNPAGCYAYGLALELGVVCKQNHKAARRHYEFAMNRGHVLAKYAFVRCLLYGIGGKKNEASGAALMNEVADGGHPNAQYDYAVSMVRYWSGKKSHSLSDVHGKCCGPEFCKGDVRFCARTDTGNRYRSGSGSSRNVHQKGGEPGFSR